MDSMEMQNLNITASDPWGGLEEISVDELGKLLDEPLPSQESIHLRTNEQHIGFDSNAGNTWIYPNNLPLRSYQYSITHAALFRNTLVVLPTGLGKTFIAAVVMYNIYRWYPKGKVIFMAPTRPLVAQQIEACQRIMAFPIKDTAELTGKLQKEKRSSLWHNKRVFFATPQVVQADMLGDTNFPFDQVKLLVIDEAHKARGRYAYNEVVQGLWRRNQYFRVLALSATPGRTMEDVAEVVRNLFISHLEVRWDSSIDVVPYIHQRSVKTIVVHLSDEIKRVKEKLIEIIDPYMRQLIDAGVLSGSHQHITRNFLIFEQKRFRERSFHQQHPQQSAVTSNFSICISLFHSLELLERHGLRVFLNSFEDDDDGRPKFVLTMNPYLRDLVASLREELGPNPFDISAHTMTNGQIAEVPKDLDFGHPKFEKARKAVLEHFQENPESRAIVFCEYRESVMLIHRLLLQHAPLLKPRCFVGQGGTNSALRALSQKQQIEMMSDFRKGKSNILIATSIGEEGIDVGEVELIVCFDMSTSNPTRFIQRIGRTGRQKRGHVVILVTEGKEQQILKEVLAQKDLTNKKILKSSVVKSSYYKQSPRLVPIEYNPECVKSFIKPAEVEVIPPTVIKDLKTKKTLKAPKTKEKLIESSQDLRKFFKKVQTTNLNAEEVGVFEATQEASTIKEHSMDKIKNLFRHLNVPSLTSSNTQLLETQITPQFTSSPIPKSTVKEGKTKSTLANVHLEANEIRKINKLLKSSTQPSGSQSNNNFLKQLKSSNFSRSGKLGLLKSNYKMVREICEKMDILEALELEDDISTEEKEIRETFQTIMKCFKDRSEFNRFLEDVEIEARAIEDQAAIKCSESDEMDMTDKEFEYALIKVFQNLDEQGNDWDNFDYRQEELQKTKAYKDCLKNVIQIPDDDDDICVESVVFDPKTNELDQTSYTIMDSKYCSQWEKDFNHSRVVNKSTPLQGPLVKAFERQKDKSQGSSVRKRLETVMEQKGNQSTISNQTGNSTEVEVIAVNDDVVELLSSDESHSENVDKPNNLVEPSPLKEDLLNLHKAIEASFMLRQQSTPIQQKKVAKPTSPTMETSFEHELELDLDVFDEPLAEELELGSVEKDYSQNSSKENIIPINPKKSTATTKHAPSNLFSLLESKPTNSIMTPKFNKFFNKTPTIKKTPTKSPCLSEFILPKSTSAAALLDSPKSRPSTAGALKKYETSPSIITTYTKRLQHFDSLRRMQSKNLESEESKLPAPVKTAENNKIPSPNVWNDDSPIVRKSSDKQNFKRKILESGTESDVTPPRRVRKENSDSDFEEIVATQRSKRPFLSRRREKRMKRARLCSFFEMEAEKSGGSGHTTDDDDENTLDNFVCDSVIVADDDHDVSAADAPTSTQMQAIYLQSVRSPHQRRGAFKIPSLRTYNEPPMDIYSQEVDIEPSQYIDDSFVVNEGDQTVHRSAEVSLCPLEQAERILKERKRKAKQRRLGESNGNSPLKKRTRKCYQLKDDSDTSDGIG